MKARIDDPGRGLARQKVIFPVAEERVVPDVIAARVVIVERVVGKVLCVLTRYYNFSNDSLKKAEI